MPTRRPPRPDVPPERVDDTAEPHVLLTPELRHSLANLIDNAIQFAEEEVEIVLAPSQRGLALTIQDDGPGFPPEMVDWLGEPFLSTRRDQGGLGLGVFIANTLLARAGAQIRFDNTERGARVRVSWTSQHLNQAFGELGHDRRHD